jgi:murein DD-endopeptidase MepM/ murein hydrolase activator NlpD/SH3-like domain-containing protein
VGRTKGIVIAICALGLAGCEQIEQMQAEWRGDTPHQQYLADLHNSGFAGTALTQAWLREAREAIDAPLEVDLPLLDEGWFDAGDPTAIGYRFSAPRGRLITVSLAVDPETPGRVFVDLFRLPSDDDDELRTVPADTLADGSIQYEPRRDGEFLVRVQPELLVSGSYRLTLAEDPALAFPVAGHGVGSIQSVFGVARDGGRRSHHGVDIFARRGTPVIASVAGRVNRVEVTNLGGNVVWLRDERMSRNLYYAHLESQAVSNGQRVEVGDTLGFVGNSGNARTTPPHLHFGIYSRGPTDPDPYIRPSGRSLAALTVDRARYGSWVRTENDGIRLREAPSLRADERDELGDATPLLVIGGSGEWYRVRTADGRQGYIAARLTEPLDAPIERAVVANATELRSRPQSAAPRVDRAEAQTEIDVLGRAGDYALVRGPSGRQGWVQQVELRLDR